MDESRNQTDLLFQGAKRIPANVLTSESWLFVNRCDKSVIALFRQDVKKGQCPIEFFFKSETKRWMEGI